MYLLEVDTARVVEFELDSPAPASFRVADHQGNILLDADNGFDGARKGSVEVTPDQSHFLVVETTLQSSASSDIGSSVALRPFTDPDDGGRLGPGKPSPEASTTPATGTGTRLNSRKGTRCGSPPTH